MSNADQFLQTYLNGGHESVEGWFYPLDMLLFLQLHQIQIARGWQGDICELGVYQGKSLIQLHLCSRTDERVYGFDLFTGQMLEQTQRNLAAHATTEGTGKLQLIKANTSDFNVDSLAAHVERPLRLLHIDAGHEYHEILHCLYTFSPYVANTGVIMMDDYFDRDWPGVEQAVMKFCMSHSPRRFVPFLAGHNKMYLCVQGVADQYQRALINHPSLKDACRLSRLDDCFQLVAAAKTPMTNEQVNTVLDADLVPYKYPVDEAQLRDDVTRGHPETRYPYEE